MLIKYTMQRLLHTKAVILLKKVADNIKTYGFKKTTNKILWLFFGKYAYKRKVNAKLYSKRELREQRNYQFSNRKTFSIVVPLYNTPPRFLKEMIQSVIDQTYSGWELCMADGSDEAHKDVKNICLSYAKKNPRIKYIKLEENLGISGNTNVCLTIATGEYVCLLDHDDLLHPAALFEMMKAIQKTDADFLYTDENTFHIKPRDAFCPHYKPDYAPDTLRSNNYICHFTVFSRNLVDKAGYFRSQFDGSQDYDMILRLTEQAQKIVHIPKILYYWRAHKNSVAQEITAKPYVIEAAQSAIQSHLVRMGLNGVVENTRIPSMYRVRYTLSAVPLVSIIIANRNHVAELKTCIESIYEKTSYPNFEVVIVENSSDESNIGDYYNELIEDKKAKVVIWNTQNKEFNYSSINNYGVSCCQGEYYVLLNNDVEVISADWIQEMLMFAQRKDVGAVGAKLYYPNDTIQHAGVGIGIMGVAAHYHRGFPRNHPGYMGRLIYAHNVSAVTGACVMISRNIWKKVGGLDVGFAVAFNDIDLCMRIRKAGYLIVWTPFAELYHHESQSRGMDNTPEKQARFLSEVNRFQEKWSEELRAGDPYYNPNLTLYREDFSLK